MGALRNPPNRQGSNMIFGTYLLDIPAFGPQAQPLPALPAATNRGWSNRGTILTGSAPDYSRPQTEGVLAVAEVKSWWLRRRKHPAHGFALWPRRSCPGRPLRRWWRRHHSTLWLQCSCRSSGALELHWQLLARHPRRIYITVGFMWV